MVRSHPLLNPVGEGEPHPGYYRSFSFLWLGLHPCPLLACHCHHPVIQPLSVQQLYSGCALKREQPRNWQSSLTFLNTCYVLPSISLFNNLYNNLTRLLSANVPGLFQSSLCVLHIFYVYACLCILADSIFTDIPIS